MQYFLLYFIVALAALLNAVMDRCENIVAFNRSVFSHLDKRFWCKDVSWQYAKKTFGYKWDAWHMAKSAVICLLLSVLFFNVAWWHYFLLGVTWNVVFVFSYHKLLYR